MSTSCNSSTTPVNNISSLMEDSVTADAKYNIFFSYFVYENMYQLI
jgi:hypothetical protein